MKNLIVMTLAMLIAGSAAAAGTTDHFLADRHVERGVKCESCHVNGDTTKPVRKAQCLVCHKSYEALANARRATRVTSRARFPAASATSSI